MPKSSTNISARILYLLDPESFASLILVDRTWREAAQTPHLYAHHLSRCPSFSLNNSVMDAGPFTDESLPYLKRKFAEEVKRNLFEAYLQPHRTVVSLVSTTTSSSAAFPGGEAFDFVFSANGHWTLALSSSRIYVIDTASERVSVQREFKVLRRPISAAILDDGSMLAVLSSNQHVYVYNLTATEAKHLRSIPLENSPHSIALSSDGDVLATAFDGGVDIYSLKPSTADADWRTIKCERVDALTFSHDGTMLMGTTRNSKSPNTVIFTAPYLTDDNMESLAERISHMWTTQIVFPNSTRDCSHATLLPNRADGDAHWIFTYDRVFESFRAVRTDDLRNGTTYFTGPKRSSRSVSRSRKKLIPCTLPAANHAGDLVAAGFSGKDVWLYGVPEGLDVSTVSQNDETNSQSGSSAGPSTPAQGSIHGKNPRSMTRGAATELNKLPKWQMLVDRYRNVFAKGHRIAEIPGVSTLAWVSRQGKKGPLKSLRERLVVAAPGGIPGDPELQQDDFAAVDGGRLIILDFDRSTEDGKIESLTFEVGNALPELLKEENVDLETEVAIARRRTVRKGHTDSRTVVDVLATPREMFPLAPTANAIANAQASAIRNQLSNQRQMTSSPALSSPEDGITLDEAVQTFEGPYSQTNPRSRDSIYRSATAVAANRERNPPRIVSDARVEYRRPGNRSELPHESDADNWVPPPPPYAPKADVPLPEHLQRSLLPKPVQTISRVPVGRERPRRASTMYETVTWRSSRRISSPSPSTPSPRRPQVARTVSDTLSQLSQPVSPLTPRTFASSSESEESSPSRRASLASPGRRPMSDYLTRMTGSIKRPQSARITSESIPPVPQIPPNHSLTVVPNNRQSQRLEAPLPSLPHTFNVPPDPTEPAIVMPSAEQLANLNSHVRQPPPRQAITTSLPPGSIVPAPPRGALGATGNTSPASASARRQSQSHTTLLPQEPPSSQYRSLSTRFNPLARSSPALLRPAPQRLDTIESISSNISRPRTSSQGQDLGSRGSTTAQGGNIAPMADPGAADQQGARFSSPVLSKRRSQSAGPALRLDRLQMPQDEGDRTPKRGFFGSGRKVRKAKSREELSRSGQRASIEGPEEKVGRCTVM